MEVVCGEGRALVRVGLLGRCCLCWSSCRLLDGYCIRCLRRRMDNSLGRDDNLISGAEDGEVVLVVEDLVMTVGILLLHTRARGILMGRRGVMKVGGLGFGLEQLLEPRLVTMQGTEASDNNHRVAIPAGDSRVGQTRALRLDMKALGLDLRPGDDRSQHLISRESHN